MGANVIRLVPFVVATSATTTSDPIDLDYRFGPTPVRSFFISKSAAEGPALLIQAAPLSTGPWATFLEVSAGASNQVLTFQAEFPFVRVISPGGGPLVTVYGVV